MSDGGKGSAPRPLSVPNEVFEKQWKLVFGERMKQERKNAKSSATRVAENKEVDKGSVGK